MEWFLFFLFYRIGRFLGRVSQLHDSEISDQYSKRLHRASTDEDGRLRTVHPSICPCGQRTEILDQTVHLMD